MQQMHLVCFLLLFMAKVFPSGSGNRVHVNLQLVKAAMRFLTIPYYLYQICNMFNTLDKQFITFTPESDKDNFTIVD